MSRKPRVSRHGAPSFLEMTMTCTVENCGKPLYQGRRYCGSHYMRAWRYGDPLHRPEPQKQDVTGKRFGSLVALERLPSGHWLCRCDCGVDKPVTLGSLNKGQTTTCGTPLRHPRQQIVTYGGAHDRVEAAKDRASLHACIDCRGQAQHWSYDHSDPNEQTETLRSRGYSYDVAYSLDPDHYDPRCVACHRRFDRGHALARQTMDA